MHPIEMLYSRYPERFHAQHSGSLPRDMLNVLSEEPDISPVVFSKKRREEFKGFLQKAREEAKKMLGIDPPPSAICIRFLDVVLLSHALTSMEEHQRSQDMLLFAYDWDRSFGIEMVLDSVSQADPHTRSKRQSFEKTLGELQDSVPLNPPLSDQVQIYLGGIRNAQIDKEHLEQDPTAVLVIEKLFERTLATWSDNTFIKDAFVFGMQEAIRWYKGLYPLAVEVAMQK